MDIETVAVLLNVFILVAFAGFAAFMADRQNRRDEREKLNNHSQSH